MKNSKELFKKIEEYDSIVIFGHLNPDGDCYGSQVGLREAIKETFPNKKVYTVGSGFKPGVDLFGPMDEVGDEIIANSLCIGVDFNIITRSEDQRIGNGLDLCMIDHHIISEPFGSVRIIETEMIAASEIITKFIIENNMKLNLIGASSLYMGIVTDSGRFQYQPITKNTFEMCGYLSSFGIEMKRIYDRLYVADEASLRFKGYVYSHYQKSEHGVIYCIFDKETCKSFGYSGHHTAVLVNLLANVKDCPIWVFFGEEEDGKTFVEYRSGGINVQQIAVQYGGGGHLCAAGCNVSSLEMAHEIIQKLDDLIVQEGK